LLARCNDPEKRRAAVKALKKYDDLSCFTQEEFSARTQLYWLISTKAGLATGFNALQVLVVGMIITRQALYAAIVASLKAYALLHALGIRRARIALCVLAQAAGVGLTGVLLSVPLVWALGSSAALIGLPMNLPWWLIGSILLLSCFMALLSGLATLHSIHLMDPNTLLR